MDYNDNLFSEKTRLVANEIDVKYGDNKIIDCLNIEIPTAKITILIGANGCGKSTLLKSMARVLTPSSGSVWLDGKDIHKSNTKQVAKKLGLLPQGPVAPEGLTVKELVSQGRFPHQSLLRQWSSKDETAVNNAMALAKVDIFADLQVDDLSGGQRQRCWVAMAMAQETDIILLDEPTTFLDLKIQVELMDLLSTLAHENGRTLVVVLHELNLAAAYADNLIMIKDGKIVFKGEPNKIFTSDNLKFVFDLNADILIDPSTNRHICIPKYKNATSFSQSTEGAST
ncbi:MAG: cobalamin/Fe(3+)-siderophore ABC transporter ATP-binding protein [Hyphomicrobiales bacterium]|nr:MAG: cobalamin/Fe(3+)-siderophore ABC transporter ATP-binding protein [Hyphomicrobiales bacterium]